MPFSLLILIALILLSGFFSGAEVALLSVSQIKAKTFKKQRRKGARALSRLKSNPRRMIITILIGNNVVNIAAASLVTIMSTRYFGSEGIGIATGILTLLILIFGEITPKTFASRYASRIALLISEPIEILGFILYPLVILLEWLTDTMHNLVKLQKTEPITEAEIKEMIDFGVKKKVVHPEEQFIINRALKFSDIKAKEVMIPLARVFALDGKTTLKQSLAKMIKSGFSRIPLYEKEKKNITAIAMIKDVARELANRQERKSLIATATKPLFVSENIGIDDLFKIFQKGHIHMAVVKNSRGAMVGIVTLEDLIEELVGEITDESDNKSPHLKDF